MIDSLLQQNNPYSTGGNLSSDSITGEVSGGSFNDRREAKGKKRIDAGAVLGAGMSVGSAALSALDTDDKYGGMDVGAEALKYGAMGAALGPIGAGVGFAVGGAIGLFKKNKFEKDEKKEKKQALTNAAFDSSNLAVQNDASDFYGPSQGSGSGMFGVEQIDNFIKTNR